MPLIHMRLSSLVGVLVVCVGAGAAWGGTLSVTTPATGANHDFGNVSVSGGPTANFAFVLTNSGSSTEVTGFVTSGSCGEFTINGGALPLLLQNGDTITFGTIYNPNDRTADTCTVTPTFSPADPGTGGAFTVTGDGIAPVLQVTSPMLAFANQRFNGGTPQVLNVMITNVGEQTIAGGNLTVTLAIGTQFSVGAATGLPIANGESANVPITFDPTSVGAKSDTVTLAVNNDSPGDPNPTVMVTGMATQSTQTFTPGSLNVGAFEVGSNGTGSIDVGNSGSAPLNIASVRIMGTHAGDFAFTDHNCSGQGPCAPSSGTVGPGGLTTFAIRCTPSMAGARTATFQVTSDDPASPRSATLSCTGTSPEVTVAPLSLPFGTVRVGASTQLPFTISNSNAAGTSPLTYSVTETITDVSVTCAPACSGTLAPGGMATVTATFAPTASGLRSGNVVVTTNDPDEATVNVAMTGTGVESDLAVTSPFAMGNVPAAQTGGSVQNLVITNNGGASLNTVLMTLSGSAAFSFAFPSGACTSGTTCSRVVTASPGGTANIPLRCDPSGAGAVSAMLNIQSDDPAPSGGTNVTVTCTGTTPVMTVMPALLSFGNQRTNASSTAQTITVSNLTGTSPLNYTVTAPGTHWIVTVGAATCNPTCGGLTVAVGGSATVGVVFRPTTTGLKNATVLIDDTDNFNSDVGVAVSGTGVEPVASLSTGGTLAFGNVVNGTTSAAQTITVMNTGSMDLAISGVASSNMGDFDLSGPTGGSTVTTGNSQSWSVACDPETRGAKSGTITISNNSNNAPSIVVALTCLSQEGEINATAAAVPVVGGVIDFGPVRLNTSAMTTVTLVNPGNVDVTVTNISISPGTEGFTSTALSNMVVPANSAATRTFNVVFAPTLDAQGMATLTITTDWNDPVITLRGDGEPNGFGCSAVAPMLGEVPWDGTQAQVVNLRNTGVPPVVVQSVAFVSGDIGEFAAIPAGTGEGSLGSGQTRPITITAAPTDSMLGPRSAVLRITTDLPVGMGQLCDVPLSYTSVGPAVTLAPGMVIDFGGVDIDGGPVTVQLSLTNSGSGRMDIASVGALTGSFSRSNFADLTVEAAETATIAVTFDPSMERDASNPESQSFTIVTDGLYMGGTQQPPNIQIMVRGFGTDQHLAVADTSFPPTYRYPTDAQVPTATCGAGGDQPCAVRVCNTGGSTLDVSMVLLDSAVFELASSGPLVVAAGSVATPSCSEVAVAFRPIDTLDFAAIVTIMNNTTGMEMAEVRLSGPGKAREVTLPGTVALGTVPVDDLDLANVALELSNGSAATFTVAELRPVGGDGAVEVRLGTSGAALPPGSHRLDGTLHLARAGVIDQTFDVFLDGDPEPHGQITITGEAIERENYYSCSSGRDVGLAGGLLVGLALVLRRRPRATGGRGRRATAPA